MKEFAVGDWVAVGFRFDGEMCQAEGEVESWDLGCISLARNERGVGLVLDWRKVQTILVWDREGERWVAAIQKPG